MPEHIVRSVDAGDAIKALAHLCNYMLLHMAAIDMDSDGQSSFLNTLITNILEKGSDELPDGAKSISMAMIAAVEDALKQEARTRADEGGVFPDRNGEI